MPIHEYSSCKCLSLHSDSLHRTGSIEHVFIPLNLIRLYSYRHSLCISYIIVTVRTWYVSFCIQVPSVACNDKDGAVSDEDYKSLERPVTTTSAGAAVLPMHPNPSAAVGKQRHHEHHQIEFRKSVEGTGDRISRKSPSVQSDES